MTCQAAQLSASLSLARSGEQHQHLPTDSVSMFIELFAVVRGNIHDLMTSSRDFAKSNENIPRGRDC